MVMTLTRFSVDRNKAARTLMAAEQQPVHVEAENIGELRRLAKTHLDSGSFNLAESCFRQAIALTENSQSWPYIGLGATLLELGRMTEADMAFLSAGQCDADSVASYVKLARHYQSQGRIAWVEKMYQNILDIEPGNPIATKRIRLSEKNNGTEEKPVYEI